MGEIHFSARVVLEKKKKSMAKAAAQTLHVVSDFDRTLTKAHRDGRMVPSAFAFIRDGNYLTKDYVKEAHALFEKYHPIETDPYLSAEEKMPHMQAWWQEHLELMIRSGLCKEVLVDILRRYDKIFREGAARLFRELERNGIPMLILSSGLGDLIKGFLEKEGLLSKNVHIISNFYDFDDEGKITGYKDKPIHVYNKNEGHVKGTEYENETKHRKNVILLGDSLGDIDMADGFPHEQIIKIGFLNEKEDEQLEVYLQHYDVVITGDADMHFVNELLEELLNNELSDHLVG